MCDDPITMLAELMKYFQIGPRQTGTGILKTVRKVCCTTESNDVPGKNYNFETILVALSNFTIVYPNQVEIFIIARTLVESGSYIDC